MSSADDLEAGRLFPRFSRIKELSLHLMAAAADYMVRSGLGSLPADFDAVVRRTAGRLSGSGAASNLALWEAYAAAHMFDPAATAKL